MKNHKVVALNPANDECLPPELISRLLDKGKEYGLAEIIPIKTSEIQVASWVQMKCRYGCQRFNRSWCCPPATPSPAEVRTFLHEYRQALLLINKQKRQPALNHPTAKKRMSQMQYWKGTVSLERLLFLAGYYKSFSLVAVCCALCKECAYPSDCNFPQEKRPSVESFSIDVFGTLQQIGRTSDIAQGQDDSVKLYSIILVQ